MKRVLNTFYNLTVRLMTTFATKNDFNITFILKMLAEKPKRLEL